MCVKLCIEVDNIPHGKQNHLSTYDEQGGATVNLKALCVRVALDLQEIVKLTGTQEVTMSNINGTPVLTAYVKTEEDFNKIPGERQADINYALYRQLAFIKTFGGVRFVYHDLQNKRR